ncbi:SOS response-associated peptidase [Novosphingobium sp. 9]|uniref:SOS response-associated peptidase n=1 Tax=Novosphingobium sp. 9 TaxID=2025349 RepID=UPI0021B568AD|nr:SOS response-associated peptidase family protein [Novosphingobium sp. 9]
MCNLYRMEQSVAEAADLFGVQADSGANVASEIYPGYPGLVATCEGVRAMTWGFPLVLKSKKTGQPLKPKPVNNAREDKLSTAFWRTSFAERRCLIPASAWAEAEGAKGHMTRTWYSLPDQELFAVGGLWRPTHEWGEAYSMVMVDGCEQMADVHDRMPTIIAKADWQQWMEGKPEEAFALCRTWEGRLDVDRTDQPWVKRT